ncbi:MAG TPA: phage protein Gp36 family protein [Thiobacillus sp.]|nr:phage protein Gp36 family protein [Thiobacillus sp.]
MSYVTNADIEKRVGPAAYVQLTDDEDTGSANEDRVDEARLAAEGGVNSYLARPGGIQPALPDAPGPQAPCAVRPNCRVSQQRQCQRPGAADLPPVVRRQTADGRAHCPPVGHAALALAKPKLTQYDDRKFLT